MTIGFRMKDMFFDRKHVIDAVGRTTARVLARFGAFVRTRDISSMLGHNAPKGFGKNSKVRDRQATSLPGSPPMPHSGLLVKYIQFAYDKDAKSVVIGPEKLGGLIGNAVEALEYGGESVARVGRRNHRKTVKIMVRARPSANPAAEAELPKLPGLWRDAIK